MIEKVFSALTAEQAVARLDAAGIANARLNTPEEVWNHPQLQARDRWREVKTPGGAIPALLPPAAFPDFEARMDPVPGVGEHTDAILAGLGYGREEIAALRAAAAV
jgi:itaconate CoA-transferase